MYEAIITHRGQVSIIANDGNDIYNAGGVSPWRPSLKPFSFVAPKSLAEAYQVLAQAKSPGQIRPIVGGTDLVDQMRVNRRTPSIVMDIKHIPEMKRLEWIRGEGLHLGAAVSCTDTAAFPHVKENFPSLYESCLLVGSTQIQNRASVAGNIGNSSPSADTVPGLITYSARVVVVGPKGRREVLLEEFFTGPGQNTLGPDEIILEVMVPPPPRNSSGHYLRFIPRNEMDIAVAGVASMVALEPRSRRCRQARIALAAVAPTPVRARDAEAVLEGREVTADLIQEAGEAAVNACKPISDVRGGAEYRKELVKVLTRRTLRQCMESLGQPV
ncbi:MAG: xanthine dehydrogenase family protein subunit M [Chloroflexi bacterium]|nr:xanthine dehydrogenase family protein subunit M [Chloroflexota bacterium]